MTDSSNSATNERANAGCVFAADLGGTHLRAATVGEDSRTILQITK